MGPLCKIPQMIERVIQHKSVYASVAHRYWNSQWSEAENQKIYGRDASIEGIGSNLRLELAVVAGNENELSASLKKLKALVDHQCLFAEGELKERPSTLENIAFWLARNVIGEWISLTVWESEHLGCRVRPGSRIAEMIFKQNNLWLTLAREADVKSGLAIDRAAVQRAVRDRLVKLNQNNDSDQAKWSRKLFLELQESLPALCALKIDLGSHGELVVHS